MHSVLKNVKFVEAEKKVEKIKCSGNSGTCLVIEIGVRAHKIFLIAPELHVLLTDKIRNKPATGCCQEDYQVSNSTCSFAVPKKLKASKGMNLVDRM